MTAGGEFGNLRSPRRSFRGCIVIPGLRAKVVDSKTPALRPLGAGAPVARLAGMLCPNPVLADGRRLDEILGTGFASSRRCRWAPQQRARLEQRGAVVHIAEAGTDLAEWLRRGHAKAAIVRPDRTVMRAGRHIDELCAAVPSFTSHGRAE